MANFFTTWTDVISGIGTGTGLLIGVCGFALTTCQLSEAKRVLRASNTYTIQRDARDLINSLTENEAFGHYVWGFNPTGKYDADEVRRAEVQIGRMVNF